MDITNKSFAKYLSISVSIKLIGFLRTFFEKLNKDLLCNLRTTMGFWALVVLFCLIGNPSKNPVNYKTPRDIA